MERTVIQNLNEKINQKVKIEGWVYRIRKLKKFSFVIIRDRTGLIQCVVEHHVYNENLHLEDVVCIIGKVEKANNDIANYEIQVEELEVLNEVKEELAFEINQPELLPSLDILLNHRVLSLRHPINQAIFKIQNTIVQTFRNVLIEKGFTEIFTPKLVSEGTEGGTEVFEVDYFGNKMYLAQSPQFYKQMLVGAGFERVFEVSQVYRAEKHNTSRHLNEYVSMDLEMGFIEDENDLMNLEEDILKRMCLSLKEREAEFNLLGVEMPDIKTNIPRIRFDKAREILKQRFNVENDEHDLEPESEKLLCRYAQEVYNCPFIFVTHYPREKRPMYTMPCEEKYTHSFDLLYNGTEITTGGLRIHQPDKLIENMKYFKVDPTHYPTYIEAFKQGMPPHGGLAIGLERITVKMLGLENIREASYFPRDCTRMLP